MYLRNKKKIRYIIVSVVLSYITGCQGLNKSNLGFRNEDNQNKAQGVFNTSASSQGVRSCEVLSVAGVLGPDIVRFFFPTLSEPQVLAVVGLSEKPLKDSAFNKLLDEHTSILLEKYLENKELYVKLHTYLNENSILSAIWKEEKGSSNKFDLESMIPNLVMKECSSYVLKTHVKKILSGSSPVTELTDYPDWVTEVNRIQSLMYLSALSHGNILAADKILGQNPDVIKNIQSNPKLYFEPDLYHNMYKNDSQYLVDFMCKNICPNSRDGNFPLDFYARYRMGLTPRDNDSLPISRSTFNAVLFSAKEVFERLLFDDDRGTRMNTDGLAMLTKFHGRDTPQANVLTLACMTSHSDIDPDRKKAMMKYLLDLFLGDWSHDDEFTISSVNIIDAFSGTIQYLTDSPSNGIVKYRTVSTSLSTDQDLFPRDFKTLFEPLHLDTIKGVEMLDREKALKYLIKVLEAYDVQGIPYKKPDEKPYKSKFYAKELFGALKFAVCSQKERLLKALLRLDLSENIRNNEYSECTITDLLEFSKVYPEYPKITQIIEDYIRIGHKGITST